MHLETSASFVKASSPCWFVVLPLRSVVHLGRHGSPLTTPEEMCQAAVAQKATRKVGPEADLRHMWGTCERHRVIQYAKLKLGTQQ